MDVVNEYGKHLVKALGWTILMLYAFDKVFGHAIELGMLDDAVNEELKKLKPTKH